MPLDWEDGTLSQFHWLQKKKKARARMSADYTPFERKVTIVPLARSSSITNPCVFQHIYLKAGIENTGWLRAGYGVLPTFCVIGQSGYDVTKSCAHR